MSDLIYDSIRGALNVLRVSYNLIEDGDSIKVEVKAPYYQNKRYFLPGTYSLDYPKDKIKKEVEDKLMKKYGIEKKCGYIIR